MWQRGWIRPSTHHLFRSAYRRLTTKPIISIDNGTFFTRYPPLHDSSGPNPPLLQNLTFSLPSSTTPVENWSVISPSSVSRTTFLQILAGQHICLPPQARRYPYLSDLGRSPHHAIKYVGFDAERGSNVGGTNVRGAYLSARYESRREETDFTLRDYLLGQTELNALAREESEVERMELEEVAELLNLGKLMEMPVANLSNGQTRRARIAKALMAKPEVVLLDGPFMGLDPNTLRKMDEVLRQLATQQKPRLVMSLRPEDGVPSWTTHLVVVDAQLRVLCQGPKERLFTSERRAGLNDAASFILDSAKHGHHAKTTAQRSRDGFERTSPALRSGEPLVDMRGVKVAYGDKVVLGDWSQRVNGEERPGLWWSLHRGQRCGIFGPNGSGKTTMLSLITSDHPQTYSLPIKLFGRSRLPGPGEQGISVFDIQRRMGHSSPEVHAFFPKQLMVRRVLESAWADAPLSKPNLSEDAQRRVDACLRWFARELNPGHEVTTIQRLESAQNEKSATEVLNAVKDGSDVEWAKDLRFRELSFSNQRLMLFLRAIVASPDLVILDEALSGVDENVRDKALLFLSHGEEISRVEDGIAHPSVLARHGESIMKGLTPEQALLVISHAKEDVPGCVRDWICLPDPGEGRPARLGVLPGPLELNPEAWDDIWHRD